MKAKEFFKELKKIDKKHATPFLSKLGYGTSIGRVRLRCVMALTTTLNQNGLFCPITAVYYNTTNKFLNPMDAEDAAALMGLSKGLTCKIISASDDYHHRGCPSCGNDIFRVTISKFLVWIYRSRILKILDLHPVEF